MSALTDLQNLFRDLFQLELADLDFGIYRLLRLKREEIEAFLNKQLPSHVEKAFQSYAIEERTALEGEISILSERVRKEISEEALSPNGDVNPQYQDVKVKAAQELLQRYQTAREKLKSVHASEAQMAEVFNHLYSFFSRYYDSGDFIPRRRYGALETYAVPYRGEEVFFHWANKDQHYVKTAENFRDYAFTVDTLSGPSSIRFLLTEASVPPGNLKGDTRYFFPVPGEAAWDTHSRTFRLPFHYRLPMDKEVERYGKNSKFQEGVLQEVLPKILKRVPDVNVHAVLAAPVDQKDGQDLSLLLKRLRHFCRRNSTDYFIHKDLEGFLKRELEFYIKDQVLHLGDLDGDLESKRRTVRVFRELAEEVIMFLVQIENVQKRLFEKRKFVLRTDYLVPIKEVPRELWKEVLSNKEQLNAWKDLFAIEPSKKVDKGKEEFLKEHPTLVVNTAYFSPEFKDRLLASFSDLDGATDGLLVHAENYQALQLLERKYAGKIKCVYTDPPYNTGNDEFIYKDRYRHSSWLAMIEERLRVGQKYLSQDGTITISVDDVEISPLIYLARNVFGDEQQLATLVWDRNRKNDATFFSVGHEYMLVFAQDKDLLKSRGVQLRELKPGIEDARKKFEQLRKKYKDNWSLVQADWNQYVRGLKDYETKGILSKYPKMAPRGPYRDDGNINWPGTGGPRYTVPHPKTKKPCKIPKSGWRYPTEERFWEEYDKGNIAFGVDETTVPGVIYYLFESTDQVMGTVFWSYAQTALDEFNDLFGRRVFENPKNWRDIKRVCNYLTARDDWICDYFAGSGTTGHAVIELNRESQSQRRFLLVEMADYFDSDFAAYTESDVRVCMERRQANRDANEPRP